MMEFVIIAPNKALPSPRNYRKITYYDQSIWYEYDDAKALDVRLGMMLVKRFKNDITIPQEVKENKSNPQRGLILYGPTYASYENGKLLRYSLSAIGSANILSTNYKS
ncbi:hypothetical protein N5853_11045 [Bartonella sp. HY329]|uniref:hypothetical protein n=1 Tax=unclassified Bartonella TaxID=2645622 RepID=UPI0021C8C569|nr:MULTISPECIES: hypothetical protein [unclassified Bartonella]UXM94629.1 hypothetical protein N5853_11045 [Bartonella sp. HY329]UXN08952.1 hypothetical protein N5852_11055 [Bartonella sp. HY328]